MVVTPYTLKRLGHKMPRGVGLAVVRFAKMAYASRIRVEAGLELCRSHSLKAGVNVNSHFFFCLAGNFDLTTAFRCRLVEQIQVGALRQSQPLRLDGRRVPVCCERAAVEVVLSGC